MTPMFFCVEIDTRKFRVLPQCRTDAQHDPGQVALMKQSWHARHSEDCSGSVPITHLPVVREWRMERREQINYQSLVINTGTPTRWIRPKKRLAAQSAATM
jgi:hypothetical protein